MHSAPLDKKAISIARMTDRNTDFEYWNTQPYLKRLDALESIRSEYHNWKYGANQRFQRVYRVTRF